MKIDGKTKLVGIIGWPIEHTFSPSLHNAAFTEVGLDWAYLPLSVSPDDLEAAVDGIKAMGFMGFNVTMPHKKTVIEYLDGLSEEAILADAVNTVKRDDDRLVGHNTDGRGFIESLKIDADFLPEGKDALIIGAGGAARSVAISLAMSNVSSLTVVNRTSNKAKILTALIKDNFPECEVKVLSQNDEKIVSAKKGCQLIVNATSVGMRGNPGLPIDVSEIGAGHLVYDLIYDPVETEFLKRANELGAKTLNGTKMLLYQGMIAWEIWTGLKPPADKMIETLNYLMERKA